jgi:DNA repair protein RadC
VDEVSVGSLNQSIVHPRELFKTALLSSAAAIILVHNHPSGDPTPSREDIEITRRLKEAGEILGVKLLDHIIVGSSYLSFTERGLL